MPKLPAAMADQAREAAASGGGSFLLDPGVYTGRLSKVEATRAKSSNNPMWALEFDEIRDLEGSKKPGRQFTNLTLIDSSMWKLGMFFDAFGVPHDTDADELVGYRCRLEIGQRVMTQGSRAGQQGNDVNRFTPLLSGDDGYDALVKLQNRLNGGTKAKPAAKATASKAVDETAAASVEAAASDAPAADDAANDIDF